MPHHDDNEEPEIGGLLCGCSFHTFARLDDRMTEHEGPKRCRACGETIHGPYHRCR